MPSKQVTDRQKSADAIVAAVDAHSPQVADSLSRLLSPHLRQGEALPDIALLLSLLSRAVDADKHKMIVADANHEKELGDDEPARAARDDAAEALRQEQVDLREILTGIHGAPAAAHVLPGPTPRDPVVLARFAATVESNLAAATLPASRVKGAAIDKAETLETLAALRQTLEKNIQAVALEVREAQATQAAKDKAIDTFDGTFGAGATILSGMLRLAGMPELAAKLRPSARRPGQTAAQAEETIDPGGNPTP